MIKDKAGFGKFEIIVNILVIVFLGVIVISQYSRYLEKERGEKAKLVLKSLRASEKIYKSQTNIYAFKMNDLMRYAGNINANPKRTFDYSITYADRNSFTVRATRRTGINGGEYITIDQSGNFNSKGIDTWIP
ncbi:MAG: hypothetical protein V1893_00065 [Candidatus Omnitrophota bacterium]